MFRYNDEAKRRREAKTRRNINELKRQQQERVDERVFKKNETKQIVDRLVEHAHSFTLSGYIFDLLLIYRITSSR
jgi:hypothetical protein